MTVEESLSSQNTFPTVRAFHLITKGSGSQYLVFARHTWDTYIRGRGLGLTLTTPNHSSRGSDSVSQKSSLGNFHLITCSVNTCLPTKVHLVKAMVFPAVMYGCESWTIKKAECQRTDAFELWCWRRLLRVPWSARRSNQSILKESVLNIHWKDWSWSWNSNTMATWCEELIHLKRLWCGKDWRWEEKGTTEDEMVGWHHQLNGHEFE